MHIQNLIEIYKLIHKMLSTHKILSSIKGHNYVENQRKIVHIINNMDLVYVNAYTKFHQNPSICSKDIEQKQKFAPIRGHNKKSKKISNDQELVQSDPTSCPQIGGHSAT